MKGVSKTHQVVKINAIYQKRNPGVKIPFIKKENMVVQKYILSKIPFIKKKYRPHS